MVEFPRYRNFFKENYHQSYYLLKTGYWHLKSHWGEEEEEGSYSRGDGYEIPNKYDINLIYEIT